MVKRILDPWTLYFPKKKETKKKLYHAHHRQIEIAIKKIYIFFYFWMVDIEKDRTLLDIYTIVTSPTRKDRDELIGHLPYPLQDFAL